MSPAAPTHPVRTTCPYCGVGCGVLVAPDGEGGFRITGDPAHPANLGRLCSKGAALGETLGHEHRLEHPVVDGRKTDWDTALAHVAKGFLDVIYRHGPDAVAFYVSGQLLTEDYYVANKLMKGFIGSANIDTNSRLCMSSAVAGHKRAFGADIVPCGYEDLEQAELIVLVGSNAAWCHPVLFQRIKAARQARDDLKVVVIDPRRTATCEIADLHLPLAPGSDVTLLNGLLAYLVREQALDWEFLEHHVEGFAATLSAATQSAGDIPRVARACGLDPDAVGQLFRWFARTRRTVTLFSQGVNQSSAGTDKVNAIINCHLATGRIGRPGMGPFSITGQPNAMGGREVGGLANMLAAHMDFEPEQVARLGRFWRSESVARAPGLKAVDLFKAIGRGRIKAVWIMATNPLVSLPDTSAAREALRRCELVVVSDSQARTDTTELAHVLLPAATWGEKDGTVTNSERRISRQRGFMLAPAQARPDWWIVTQVARRMGFGEAFPYESAAEIFREHAHLSAFENDGERDFDIGALAGLDDAAYEDLGPVRWPQPARGPVPARVLADGRFYTDSGRARMVPVQPRGPENTPDSEYPLILNSGRVRDQWHTMTRSGRSPRLTAHMPEPLLQVHPAQAGALELKANGLASLRSRWGRTVARVEITEAVRPGTVFLPIHWSGQFASHGGVGQVVNPAVDPVSGEPEFKHTPVRVEPWAAAWCAFLLSREELPAPHVSYWVRSRGEGYWRYELAGEGPAGAWPEQARALLGEGEWLEFEDPGAGRYRGARIAQGRLSACLFVARDPQLPSRRWLAELFGRESLTDADRASLLAGRPAGGQSDAGPTVCACFGVGRNAIVEAIRSRGLTTPEAVGRHCQAGTNCGSCLPEIQTLLNEAAPGAAA